MNRNKDISYDTFNKVKFLTSQKYTWKYVDLNSVSLLECPYSVWILYGGPRITSRNRINSADFPQRIAYQKIQQDFINGVFYNLRDSFFNYGHILMFDLWDAFHVGKDNLDDYLNKMDILTYCMLGKYSEFVNDPLLRMRFRRIVPVNQLLNQYVRKYDLHSVRVIADHYENYPMTWAEYAAANMQPTQEDIDILLCLGDYREGGYNNLWFNSIAGYSHGEGKFLTKNIISLYVTAAKNTEGYDRFIQLAKNEKFVKDDDCLFFLHQCASYCFQQYDVYEDEGLMKYNKYEGKDEVALAFERSMQGVKLEYDKEVVRDINELYGKRSMFLAVKRIKDEFIQNNNVMRFVVQFDFVIDYFIRNKTGIREVCLDAVRLIAKQDKFDALRYYFLSCVLYGKQNVPLAKSIVDILFPTLQLKEKFSQLFEKNCNCNDYYKLWDALKGFYNEFDKWRGPTKLLSEDFLLKMARIEKFDEGQFEIRTVDSYCVPERKVVLIDKSEVEIRKEKFEKTASDLSELLDEGDNQDEALRPVGKPERIFDRVVADLISLFKREKFILSSVQLNDFSVDKGLMTNSIVNQINEAYFETLDDNLIEETEDGWVMNKEYYEQIKTEIQ